MLSIRNLVVGVEMPSDRPWKSVDIDAATRVTTQRALDIAASVSASITLVTVLDEPFAGFFGSEDDATRTAQQDKEKAESVLTEFVRELTEDAASAPNCEIKVVFGRPWLEILRVSRDKKHCLIVAGTRKQSVVSRYVFGSTGMKLLRNADCPVLLLKPGTKDVDELDVLAATDLSDIGTDVIHAAVTLGQSVPIRLNILHVIDDQLDRYVLRTGASQERIDTYRRQEQDDAQATLHSQLEETDYRTLSAGVQVHFAEGPPDACILSAIEDLNIDLLIMATSARGGIPGMLFGNTAERLLPQLTCSLLAIKPDDFRCPVEL